MATVAPKQSSDDPADFVQQLLAAQPDLSAVEQLSQYHDAIEARTRRSVDAAAPAQAIINIALITGNIGRPGTGANSITGQCNAMGSLRSAA